MLSVDLPTCTRDYVIWMRNMQHDDVLTLSYLTMRLGEDALGANAARRLGRDGATVCWSVGGAPDLDAPPDMIIVGEGAPGDAGDASVLTLGSLQPGDAAGARLYTLGGQPYGTAEYIASMCGCTAAYVALGALCRATGFMPVQAAQRLIGMTIGCTEPHRLYNCQDGAVSGYRQVGEAVV